jgi:hypothetical protein
MGARIEQHREISQPSPNYLHAIFKYRFSEPGRNDMASGGAVPVAAMNLMEK